MPETPSPPPAIVTTHALCKTFGATVALRDASVSLFPGETHAFVGENGAGKSTLAKLIAGVHAPTSGEIRVDNRPVRFLNPRDAARQRIALIHQEPLTFPELSAAENIFCGRQPIRLGQIDWRAMNDDAARLLQRLGSAIDPTAPVRGLSIADQQMLEFAAALSQDARVLILDETTASLTPSEVETLAALVETLKQGGAAIAFIGHRLEEVFALCERITVLRDGAVIETLTTADTTPGEILRLMVGRELSPKVTVARPIGAPRLVAKHLTRRGSFSGIDLTLNAGEIVGLAGLVGAGRTEIVRALFGLDPIDSGEIRIDDTPAAIHSPSDALKKRIALVPEDRQHQANFSSLSLIENATISVLPRLTRRGGVDDRLAHEKTRALADRLRVRCRDLFQSIGELSGGNQQKIILTRALLTDPRILLLDEPTRGVDIGAKAEVHALIEEAAAQGLAVLMVSSDLPELLALCDRIVVIREGKITATFPASTATPEAVIAAATGVGLHA